MNRKYWQFASFDKERAASLAYEYGYDEFAVLLLDARGVTSPEDAAQFLENDTELYSPFLIKDMDKAVECINSAIENNEKITVYGDYDADGVTATALLYMYLETAGARVEYYIPSRTEEGYGLNRDAVDKLYENGTNLIVTVDNGINSVSEAEYIKNRGMKLVITDHHRPGETLPDAEAVVNPHRADDESPFKDLAGVGVAFKLASALEGGEYEGLLDDFSDIAAIGTIADIVPLKGENRFLALKGIESINTSPRVGVQSLKNAASLGDKEMTSGNIAFSLAPRINAAGRIGSAYTALELLLTESEQQAHALAQTLNEFNAERQETEAEIARQAIEKIESEPRLKYSRVLVVDGESWHAGVIGIVASRLVDRYGKPAMVIARDESGEAKGSCRSIDGFSLFDALSYASDTLVRFGGHTLAAGFTVEKEKIGAFRDKINEYAEKLPVFYPVLNLDCRLNPSAVSMKLVNSISLLEPFGAENPQPVFAFCGVTLLSVRAIGATGKHMRLTFEKKQQQYTAVYFGVSPHDFPYEAGERIDIAATIDKNEFRGEVKPNIYVKAVKSSLFDDEKYFKSEALYDKFRRGGEINEKERAFMCPDRSFAACIFRFIKKSGECFLTPEHIAVKTGFGSEHTCRVRVTLDAFCELGLLKYENGAYSANNGKEKVSLSSSPTLRTLGYKE